MSNNLVKKALGLVGTLTLSATAIVGVSAPAQALGAENLVLAPTTGSLFAVPSDNTFEFKSYYKSGANASNASQMKVRLTTDGSFRLDGDSDSTIAAAKDTLISTIASSSTAGTLAGGTGSVDYFAIAVNSASDATTYTVTAQAFEDSNGNDKPDGDEIVSAVTTISFLKTSAITWTVDITQPYVADAGTADADVTANVNLSQLVNGSGADATTNAAQVFGAFSDDATTQSTQEDIDSSIIAATYDSVNNEYDFTSSGNYNAAIAAGDTVEFHLWFVAADALSTLSVKNDAIKSGSKDHHTPAAGETATKSASKVSQSAQVSSLGGVETVAAAGVGVTGSNEAKILAGDGSFQVRTLATPNSGVSKSGHTVTFNVREDTANDLDSSAVISVGGSTLTNSNAGTTQTGFTTTAVTDSDGYATITVSYTGTDDGDQIEISATIMGVDAAKIDLEFKDRTVGAVKNVTAIGTSEPYNVPKSTAYTISAAMTDQFGAAVTGAGYSVEAGYSSTTIAASVVDGIATLSMPGLATAQTLSITLQGKKNGVDAGTTESVTVNIGTATATPANLTYATAITGAGANFGVGTDTDLALNVKPFTNVDTRKSGVAPSLTAAYSTITATVLDANSAAAPGNDVTFSGDFLDFVADGVYSSDSITVKANSSGQAAVQVYSGVSGEKTLTITSGSVTKTQTMVFAAGAAANATTLEITAPESAPAGKSFTVSGVAKDKFGNAVTATNFEVTYSGPGFFSTLPTSLTNGKFSFNVLVGANDSGTGTITASIYTGDDKITTVRNVLIGAAADAANQKVNAGSFKGYVAVYAKGYEGQRLSAKIGNDWVIVPSLASNFERVVDFTGAGVDIAVRIYIDRVLIETINLTTK